MSLILSTHNEDPNPPYSTLPITIIFSKLLLSTYHQDARSHSQQYIPQQTIPRSPCQWIFVSFGWITILTTFGISLGEIIPTHRVNQCADPRCNWENQRSDISRHCGGGKCFKDVLVRSLDAVEGFGMGGCSLCVEVAIVLLSSVERERVCGG